MATSDPKRLTVDALLLLFAGLPTAACEKAAPQATAEKPGASANPQVGAKVEAKEVAPPAPSGSAEMACAPGGCGAGKCGGSKK